MAVDLVHRHEADIVTLFCVFGARITEPRNDKHDQFIGAFSVSAFFLSLGFLTGDFGFDRFIFWSSASSS